MTNFIMRLENICSKHGLKLNKGKCKIMTIFTNDTYNFDDVELVQEIKYLGIIIDNRKDCFPSQKNKNFENAIKFNHQIYSLPENSCHRMLV